MDKVPLFMITLSVFLAGYTVGEDTDYEYRLVRDLMVRYDKKVRPAINVSKAVNITFDVALAQIIDVDEKNQIMTTNCWLNQGWLDPKLRWEPAKYGNVSVIRLPYDVVWLPDIVLYNSAHITSESVSTNIIVTSEGQVTYLSMVIFKSSCSINVKYFPFDEQICNMSFSSWTFDAYQMNILKLSEEGDTSNYMGSTEWELVRYSQIREVVFFSCCPEPYIFMTYRIYIRRRPLFYLFNMVIPCLLITLVALLGFYMPSDSGEKTSMGITTLLSMTVFLMIVADKMPPTSDVLPLIGLYYGITIAVVSLATAMTVFTLNIHYKGARGREIPPLIRKIFFGYVAKFLFIHLELSEDISDRGMQRIPQNDFYAKLDGEKFPENGGLSPRFARKFPPPSQGTPPVVSDSSERQFMRVLQKVYQTIEKNEMRLADQDRKETIRQEWQQLALILDRCFLLCFIVSTVTFTLALLWPPDSRF